MVIDRYEEFYKEALEIYKRYCDDETDLGSAIKALEIIYSLMEDRIRKDYIDGLEINVSKFIEICEKLTRIGECIDALYSDTDYSYWEDCIITNEY